MRSAFLIIFGFWLCLTADPAAAERRVALVVGVSAYAQVPIPHGYPVVGQDAFETATGVHAAAIIKAMKKGDAWLADRVYSGVPAADFGRRQVIAIGPMSGKSNVLHWLEEHEAWRDRVAGKGDATKVPLPSALVR